MHTRGYLAITVPVPDAGLQVAHEIAELTGMPFVTAPNKFAALAASDGVVYSWLFLFLFFGPRACSSAVRAQRDRPCAKEHSLLSEGVEV